MTQSPALGNRLFSGGPETDNRWKLSNVCDCDRRHRPYATGTTVIIGYGAWDMNLSIIRAVDPGRVRVQRVVNLSFLRRELRRRDEKSEMSQEIARVFRKTPFSATLPFKIPYTEYERFG